MGESNVTLGEVFRLIEDIRDRDLADIKNTLRAQNGRLGKAEIRVAVLEDRGLNGRDPMARWTGAGAALAAFISGLLAWWNR